MSGQESEIGIEREGKKERKKERESKLKRK